jgi:hypothetical protein
MTNDWGFGAGFHLNRVSLGAKLLSGPADRAGSTEGITWQLKTDCQFIHLQVYKLTNDILASVF